VSITDQDATIFNGGAAFANTGGNVAVGNGSTNNATAIQNGNAIGTDGDSVATNDAAVRNDSGGDARITTGDATATGSTSNNTINQSNDINCDDCLGVVVLGDQNASIVNVGIAVANTGGNIAVGNVSDNGAVAKQHSNSANAGGGDSVAANTGTLANNSGGTAGIITGDATAVGNVATNNVTQVTNINAPGAMGVIVLTDQNASAANVGVAIANTGLNTAVGNLSESTSRAIQGAVSGAGPPADDNVASNDAIVSNDSNGSADINTGAANAAGNSSTTNLTQAINVNTTGHALVLSDQNASVVNFGLAVANTGGNVAVGNASFNLALMQRQRAVSNNAGANGEDNVAANFGSAANTSNGDASVTTGNASAAGNKSTTNVSQTVNAKMTGGLVLPDQNVSVVNAGIGVANTGLNIAVGNVSHNVAIAHQFAKAVQNSDDSVASNFGDVATSSNGSGDINTGNADSIGNDSAGTTNIAQTVDTEGADSVLSDQNVETVDFGVGISNTGLNLAIGNASRNETVVNQVAIVNPANGDAVASNFGDAATDSDGDASITTGNASAVGSAATTNISQTVSADGAKGFLLSDQTAVSANVGIGVANTGLNLAVGNLAVTVGFVAQFASVLFGNTADTVAANFGSAKTKSNGSASIHSGNASAVGTRSATNIAQSSSMNGTGFVLADQTAVSANVGLALANSGGNIAIGNVSRNFSSVHQNATLPNGGFSDTEDLVASNDGIASTDTDGSAEIWTGSATAVGNDSGSTTNISQSSDVNGAGFALVDQSATVVNVGAAVANTGLNLAVGNVSRNRARSDQRAVVRENGQGNINADDVVASNNATASATSDGSAKVSTGAANAVGNKATTNISQTSDFDGKGFTLVDQEASVLNAGIAAANSGLNVAVGNASFSWALSNQAARVVEDGAGNLNAEDVVAANTTAETATNSNGSASITTGAAGAWGNTSTTNVNQVANTKVSGSGFSLNDQVAEVASIGAGIANSGGNAAVGNVSTNTALPTQVAQVRESGAGNLNADDVVAVNTLVNTNDSNGSASVTTGNADASGSKSSSTINQTANTDIPGNGFVLNDQEASVVNVGLAASNSGLNLAIGNASTNNVGTVVPQAASVTEAGAGNFNAEDVVASNNSENGNNSDGSASINTGAAMANGNDSSTVVNQTSDTTIAGTGFALVDQEMTVANLGASIANSGLNLAAGNTSHNDAATTQAARIEEAGAGNLNIEDAVAANQATAWNQSDGSASITTGNAHGTGNNSSTTASQTADNDINKGFELVDQSALVVNAGLAVSNSGLNIAVGNASQNTNDAPQTARIREAGAGNLNIDGDAVASNTQDLSNNSDGRASIDTGCSCADGNISTTNLDANNGDGDVAIFNIGVGVSNSGLNIAVGNASINDVTSQSTARISENGAGNLNADDDVVAANTVTSENQSRGSASITTGGATGIGNTATNTVGGGDTVVVNFGIGLANTGLNVGVGNGSTNNIKSNVNARIVENGPGNLTLDDDGVASNVITEVNDSDGTVDIDTGDAYALGNRSATGIVDAEDATTINFGLAFANTGLNIGVGNTSINKTNHTANANAPGSVVSNVADLSNTSDGSANIHTGNANAFGNIASNATCQGVDFGPTCPQPVLPPLPPNNCGCGKPGENPTPQPPTCVTNCAPGPKPGPPVLARTGGSVEGLAMLGLLLLTIGTFLRRKARTA
jgi:hypothetical protein